MLVSNVFMIITFRVDGEEVNFKFFVYKADDGIRLTWEDDYKYPTFLLEMEQKVFVVKGVRFIPALSFKPVVVSGDSETNFRFCFEQNGKKIDEIEEYRPEDQCVIEVAERSLDDVQVLSQIVELDENYPNVFSKYLHNIPQIIVKVLSSEGVAQKLLISSVFQWKADLKNRNLGPLKYLGKPELMSMNMVELSCSDQNDQSKDDPLKFKLRTSKENVLVVGVKTYMEFQKHSNINPFLETPSDQQIIHISRSFARNLTESGRGVLKALEYDLFLSCGNGNWGSFLAPIVFLGQSSGVGKSKLAISLLKQRLGFYMVFRKKNGQIDEKGYPFENSSSDILRLILAGYSDGKDDLNTSSRSGTTVGKVLNFIAGVIVQYYRKYLDSYKNYISGARGTLTEDFDKIYEQVNEKLASNFDLNDTFDFKPCNQVDLDALYKKVHQALGTENRTALDSVKFTAEFIKSVLDDPELIFDAEEIRELVLNGFKSNFFNDYPFVFVLDEADQLASEIKIKGFSPITNGFEALRRAMSYLHTSTKIVFLIIGTKSNIVDLNPPVFENSNRTNDRKIMPFPIVLRGNLNSFAKEYPIYELKLTDKMLKNPLYFKFLCTLGRPLFSSMPYEEMLKLVRTKLLNGTAGTFFYVPVLWMILTGISANVLSPDARAFVASHMAYLMQIREDCRKLIVGFMSEPILALVTQKLIDENETFTNLFKMLKIKYESVDIDCGQLAEVFGCMILLRAIWTSERISVFNHVNNEPESNYFEAMKDQPIQFKSLWETPIENLLSQSNRMGANIACCRPYYRIHTVKSFLSKFIEGSGAKIEDFGLPQSVLEGYVNATHFIPLNRDFSGIKVCVNSDLEEPKIITSDIESETVPLADDRIKDKSRNVITKQLLKAAMLQFAGLRCPPGMYGFDLIIPVMLKRKSSRPDSSSSEESEGGDEKDFMEKRSEIRDEKAPMQEEYFNVGDAKDSVEEAGGYEKDPMEKISEAGDEKDPMEKISEAGDEKDPIEEEEVIENDLTFIGIQIKRSSADLTSNIEKMQARLHIVKCAREDCSGENCDFCIKEEALENIYKDQITILMSLDDEDSYNKFTSSTNYFKGCLEEDEDKLDELLESGEPVNIEEISSRSLRFMEPLVCERKQFGDGKNVLVSKSVWYDELVDFKAAAAKKKKKNLNVSKRGDKRMKIDTEGENNEEESNEDEDEDGIVGKSDGFVHRQFCICTRGWSVFKNLLPEDAPKIAEDLFNFDMPSRILKKDESHGLAALITHDAGIMYPATSNVMKGLLGRETSHYKIYNLVSDCQEKILFHQEPSESVED